MCEECLRWYPIIDEIPHMLPDDQRLMEPDEELNFMKKWLDKFPREILERGKPFNKASLKERQG